MKLQGRDYVGILAAVIIVILVGAMAFRAISKKAPEPSANVPAKAQQQTKVVGTALDKEEIRQGIMVVMPDMKNCYETMMKATGSSASGTATVKFKIVAKNGSGQLRDAEIIETTFLNQLFSSCVIDTMQKAKFPAPKGDGEVEVTFPFTFTSDD